MLQSIYLINCYLKLWVDACREKMSNQTITDKSISSQILLNRMKPKLILMQCYQRKQQHILSEIQLIVSPHQTLTVQEYLTQKKIHKRCIKRYHLRKYFDKQYSHQMPHKYLMKIPSIAKIQVLTNLIEISLNFAQILHQNHILNHQSLFLNSVYKFQEMRIKTVLILVLIGINLIVCKKTNTDQSTIQTGEMIEAKINKKGGESIILLKTDEVKPDHYLFFSVQLASEEQWEKTRTTIFRKKGKSKLLQCESSMANSCYLKGDKLISNQILTIKVQCGGKCSFRFSTYWTDIKKIEIGQTINFNFESLGIGQFFQFETSETDPTRFQFIVQSNEQKALLDRLRILGNVNGELPTIGNHGYESVPLWENGHGLFIKSDDMVQKKVMLLVMGQPSVNYTIKCSSIKNEVRNIELGVAAHDYLGKNEIHKFQIPISFDSTDQIQEIYAVDTSIFIGQITIGFFKDLEGKKQFQTKPKLFRGSSRYIFSEKDLQRQKVEKLYVIFQSTEIDSETTYSINVNKQFYNQATQLKRQIYQFMQINTKRLLYIKVKDWGFHVSSKPQDIVINLVNMGENHIEPVFRLCQKTLHECTLSESIKSSTQALSEVKVNTNGKQSQYRITLDAKTYFNLLAQQQNGVIIIELQAKSQSEPNFILLFYTDENEIYNIKENVRTEVNLQLGTSKYFYIKAKSPQITNVLIHPLLSSGEIELKSARQDPRVNPNAIVTPVEINSINFSENLEEPIYLVAKGISQSSLVLISQQVSSEQKIQEQSINSQALELLQNKEYTIVLNPGDTEIFELNPTNDGLIFKYSSTGQISACIGLSPSEQCENDGEIAVVGNKDTVEFKNVKASTKTYLKVMNANHKKSIEITMWLKTGSQVDCVQKVIGKLYSDVVQDNFCAEFEISQNTKQLEGVFMRIEMAKLTLSLQVCDNPIDLVAARFTIDEETIKQKCSQAPIKLIKVLLSKPENSTHQMKVQFVLKEKNSPLELPDGIGHMELIKPNSGQLAKYYYYLLNKVNTQILIHNKLGGVMAYLKIVEAGAHLTTTVSNSQYDIATQQSYLYLSGPEITLSQEYLQSLPCNSCVMVLVTYSDNEEISDGQNIAYTIEVTQNTVLLNQHQIHASFLYKDTTAYFRYECSTPGSFIMFDLTDHHMDCARIYVSDKQYPSELNKLDMIWGNQISVQCKKPSYYFAVQAINDCPISVVAQSTPFKLTKIRGGTPLQLSLKPNQVQFFTYLHIKNVDFKVLSLEKYGDVKIYVSEATEDVLQQTRQKQSSFKKFQFKSTTSNMVTINKGDAGYCVRCIYLIAIVSQTNLVDSSLFILDNPKDPILMISDNIISDQIKPQESVKLQYFDALRGQLLVNVYKGTVQVKMQYLEKTMTTKVNTANETHSIPYDLSDPEINYDWDPIYVVIKNIGKDEAHFSGSLVRDSNPQLNSFLIKSGITSFIEIKQADTFCLRGFFTGVKEKIYISMPKQNTMFLDSIKPSLEVNGKVAGFTETSYQNIREIEIDSQKSQTPDQQTQFILCLTNTADFRLRMRALQSGKINPLSEGVWSMTTKDQLYTVRPEKQAMFELLTCNGELSYVTDTSYSEIQNSESMILLDSTDKVSNQNNQNNHVIYYESDSEQIFLKVKSEGSLLKWLQVNQERQMGIGYLKYEIGQISENVLSDRVAVIWDPLKNITLTQTKISQVRYRLFIAKSASEAKMAANCEMMAKAQFFMLQMFVNQSDHEELVKNKSKMEVFINKNTLRNNFKDTTTDQSILNLYITLSADAKIITNTQPPKTEEYRFIYNEIQLPRTLILTDGLIQKSNTNIGFLIGGISIGVLVFFAVAYLVLKKLVPLISRVKNRMMVEEEVRNGDSAPSVDIGSTSEKKMVVDEDI